MQIQNTDLDEAMDANFQEVERIKKKPNYVDVEVLHPEKPFNLRKQEAKVLFWIKTGTIIFAGLLIGSVIIKILWRTYL